jgi:8-oxo-dGTP diphosphatase
MKSPNVISNTGAGVLCFPNEKALLVQMNYGKYRGEWILPGGMVEASKHPHMAVIREAKEETNLDV